VYKTVIRGSTVKIEYFAQNLDIGTMVSGSSGQVQDGVIEKFCYNDDPANCEKFGGLYQWSEAMGFPNACNSNLTGSAGCANTIPSPGQLGIVHQGICPSGWHIMNTVDWSNTWDGLTHNTSVLRATAGGWTGANTSGFSAVPGGRRTVGTQWDGQGTSAYFWLPSEDAATTANSEEILYNWADLLDNPQSKRDAYSIRCARDY
jgi:uncharacterized protein (TIGR02145 family)